ncbi:GDSL-type esterase/lipase family protein [Polaribacter sp. Hel_I_88]|uniref:GDSL-type esterase/lipase family protein n=1 Tax=Polaribacter sp. Hel_I_88 TaxID=1250006 RepID=UPI00047B3038|nr:GDSL-type esterase/lipase family protein [Polaribacter sp. Hel_I_88]
MKQTYTRKLILIAFLLIRFAILYGQDSNRFTKQVQNLYKKEYHFNPGKKLVVFTGSSSIRKWIDIQDYFPTVNVINNGFGGSEFSDLTHFYDELILKHAPEILFIYEGDNDIGRGKSVHKVKRQAINLVKRIKHDLPNTKVIFISPKPSLARKNIKNKYIRFNKKLQRYCQKTDNIQFADVWTVMMDENGNVFDDIFIADGLHMNKKGYDLWATILEQYLK